MIVPSAGVVALWGRADDQPLEDVRAALERAGEAPLMLSESEDIAVVGWGCPSTSLAFSRREVMLGDLRGFYFRAYDASHAPSPLAWLDVAETRVINRPSAMRSNGSKPYQARYLERAGFATRATLVTTDAAEARQFVVEQGAAVYKSVSAVRSIVATVSAEDPRFESPLGCPTHFQRRIAGDDLRVHVVGDRVFGCRIHSGAADYRYADDIQMSEVVVPLAVRESALTLCIDLDLPVAGLDLRQDRDGSWVCFEANPSPAFSMFDHSVHGGAIASAIAELLLGRSSECARSRMAIGYWSRSA